MNSNTTDDIDPVGQIVADIITSRLFVHEERSVENIDPVGLGTAVVFSARSPDPDKAKNEDAAALFHIGEESGVLSVADGVGGYRGGTQASEITVRSVESALGEAIESEAPLRSGVLNAFEQANEKINALGIGAATTLAVVELQGRQVRPYHVGDPTILVVGQRGKIKLQIVPHSPVGYAVEAGLLDERSAMHHEDRHLVSNVIGSPDMHIQVGPTLELSERDTVLVASDGLADNLHTREIIEVIRKGPLEKAASTLAEAALARMQKPAAQHPSKPDDLTFILYRLKRAASRTARGPSR